MASTHGLRKFDPADHPGNLYDAFCDFVDSFAYEYAAIARPAPTGTPDLAAWTAQEKRIQFLGRFATRSLQVDLENETTATERATLTFDNMVEKLKARYLPTQNKILANHQFHRLAQLPMESFDAYCNRVKQEARSCDFSCGAACTVPDTLIRDRIVIGTSDDQIRQSALKEQWSLADLLTNGRKMEAAAHGAMKIKKEVKTEPLDTAAIHRTRPGKYSRKGGNGKKKKQSCKNCSNRSCMGGKKCFAFGKECFECHEENHMRGSAACKGRSGAQKETSRRKKSRSDSSRRVAEKEEETSSDSGSSSSGDEVCRRLSAAGVSSAEFISHVRRARPSPKRPSRRPRYQVDVVVKEKVVSMFADTGADISIMSKKMADKLNLPLTRTRMKIKPYGMKKKIRCYGLYVGPIMYEDKIANVGIYVVKGNVEALLSGAASESLGIISFNGETRRCTVDDPVNQVYISRFPSIFSGVGKMKGVQVKFHTDPNVPPVACRKKTVPYHLEAKLDEAIERMERDGVVEDHEGPAPWISNLVLAPKDDGSIRVTVDMREPNKAILDTGLPIPKPEDIRKEFAGCKVFTKLDFRTAFHQLELDEESRILTVFPHKGKLKRHTRLTMGAKPASGELNKVLRPLFNGVAAAHIIHDDLVIATITDEEHEEAINCVMSIIEDANLTLNPNKCLFKRTVIPFWGMIISGDGVRPDPEKVQALRDATRPESKGELMSFLCMLQASSEFIPHLSKETVHLRELTKSDVRFKWTEKCQNEFARLQGLLCDATLLTFFDTSLPTFILVDAHQSGLSAVLAQGDSPATAKMVSCASRATTPVERRYHQLDLEALAVDFGLRRFRHYLVGGTPGVGGH